MGRGASPNTMKTRKVIQRGLSFGAIPGRCAPVRDQLMKPGLVCPVLSAGRVKSRLGAPRMRSGPRLISCRLLLHYQVSNHRWIARLTALIRPHCFWGRPKKVEKPLSMIKWEMAMPIWASVLERETGRCCFLGANQNKTIAF